VCSSDLVCSLRGSVCLYQGEELGLPEADVPYEALQDPYGKTFWPNFKGRDGCRTPMPWNDEAQAGFSQGQPWLPIPAEHRAINIAMQDADPSSVLNLVRGFLAWRRKQPALRSGSIRFLDAPEPVLAFVREQDGQRVLAVFNLSAQSVPWALPEGSAAELLDGHGLHSATVDGGILSLPPRGVFFASMT